MIILSCSSERVKTAFTNYRYRHGLSQRMFAKRMRLTIGFIKNLESDRVCDRGMEWVLEIEERTGIEIVTEESIDDAISRLQQIKLNKFGASCQE